MFFHSWPRLVADHDAAVRSFVDEARSLRPELWDVAAVEGRWTPAMVAEHVTLASEALLLELRGGSSMQIRTRWWQRIVLRLVHLPHILRTGTIPRDVPAPRELRPRGEELDRELLLARFQDASRELEIGLQANRRLKLTHPYFGRLTAADALRFLTTHTKHHEKQLRRTADRH
jgi:hypothetical protein